MEMKQQRQHCGTCKKRKPSEVPDHPRPIRGRCPYYEEWQANKDSRSTRGPSPHPTVVTSMQSAVTGTSPQQQQQQQQVAQVADPELELPIKVPWEQIGETGMHLNDAHAPVRTCAPLRAHINTHTCMYAVDMSRALYKCDHLLTWTSRHVRRTDTGSARSSKLGGSAPRHAIFLVRTRHLVCLGCDRGMRACVHKCMTVCMKWSLYVNV